ncbi:MAG: FCD domain-containing protein, partial [Nitrospirota bacterium]|nr:FCD domain-containing protein [Nitrospirota bacterium]
AAEAARHAKESDIQKLSVLFEDAASNIDDSAYLKQKNIEFHLLLAEASGNPVLCIIMKSVIEILNEIAFCFLDPAFEKELFLGVHTRILDAIVHREVGAVKKLIKEDILLVQQKLKESLDSRQKRSDIGLAFK